MDCEELREQLGDYVDGEALEEMCRRIQDHLRHCPGCRVEVDQVKKTIIITQSAARWDGKEVIRVPPQLAIRLKEVLDDEYRRRPDPPMR